MNRGLINPQYLTDITDAIRAKLGVFTQYTPIQMAAAIRSISTAPMALDMCDSALLRLMARISSSHATKKPHKKEDNLCWEFRPLVQVFTLKQLMKRIKLLYFDEEII